MKLPESGAATRFENHHVASIRMDGWTGMEIVLPVRAPACDILRWPMVRNNTSVQLGKQYFNAVATGIHWEPIFPGEAGLLGNDLLSKFRLTIDQPGNRVIFENPK